MVGEWWGLVGDGENVGQGGVWEEEGDKTNQCHQSRLARSIRGLGCTFSIELEMSVVNGCSSCP